MGKIKFYFHETKPVLNDRTKLKPFIEELFKREKTNLGSLSYVFCSDEHLLNINRQHLKHDFYTDVITFDLSSDKNEIIGEIYISVDRIRDNAEKEAVSFKEELHRVIFHGALHLCGFKDKTKRDQKMMREVENHYLGRYFII